MAHHASLGCPDKEVFLLFSSRRRWFSAATFDFLTDPAAYAEEEATENGSYLVDQWEINASNLEARGKGGSARLVSSQPEAVLSPVWLRGMQTSNMGSKKS